MIDNEKMIFAREFVETFARFRKAIMKGPKLEDIKSNEFILMMIMTDRISAEVTGVQVSELSTAFDVTPAAVTHMINSLEKKGYLERLADKKDRRIVLVRPTEVGIQIIESAKKQVFESYKELIDFLGEKYSRELLRGINLVINFQNNEWNND